MMLAPFRSPPEYRGETLDSYSRRHATRNHCVPADVDRAMREHGALPNAVRRHPERLQAWRTLGDLSDTAFTTPDRLHDEQVTERAYASDAPTVNPPAAESPNLAWSASGTDDGSGTPKSTSMATTRHWSPSATSDVTSRPATFCMISCPC
jgi:hypothetical protein